MLVLIGIAVVILGFALRFNPLLVVVVAAIVTGLAAGMTPVAVVAAFGKAFKEARYVSVFWLVLPVIGLLERAGLQERARDLIGRIHAATTGRLLIIYFAIRQLTIALGIPALGGHAAMVRPLIAPMAEAAAETHNGALSDRSRALIRANAAAADNIAAFFGEDIFIAVGSILLIKGFLAGSGVDVPPLRLSMWAIPTAVIALLVHGGRLLLLDRRLKRDAKADLGADLWVGR
jgi:uncharacterized membrane protein